MEQVIANLLLNSALHTPPGTEIFLAAGVDRAKSRIYFTVADRGPGLPAAMRERLFQKFQRGDAAKAGGLGLGPVDHPRLRDRPGRRRGRRARIPAAAPSSPFTCPTSRTATSPPNDAMTAPKPTILVIDDEVQIRRLLRITLEAAGYSVSRPTTGRIGPRGGGRCQPDAIVLDLGLPDLGGLEVLQAAARMVEGARPRPDGARPPRGTRSPPWTPGPTTT